jgi:hypothetical protein
MYRYAVYRQVVPNGSPYAFVEEVEVLVQDEVVGVAVQLLEAVYMCECVCVYVCMCVCV